MANGPARGLKWDLAAAQWAINFFPEVLRLAQGKFEGLPFHLHPSQQFIIGSLFGWKASDGSRRFRRAYIEMGKGNGKSPLAAGIGMYCLIADGEAQAEVYAGASMKSQAMVIFRAATQMWRQSPALSARLTPSGGNPIWNLAELESGSFFRPISTDEAHSGPMPSCALLDELHEHRDGNMLEMMERGFKSRRQPLLVMITNSGSDRNSVCWQEHQHAVRVAAGTMTPDEEGFYVGEVIDDSAFSYVCGVDKTDDPLEDESCWIKANPLLGVTMPIDELRRAVRQAKQIPGKLNNVLRLHLCTWTDSPTAWMSRASLEPLLSKFNPMDHQGEEAYLGIDLSATQDMTAIAVVVPTGMRAVDREDRHGNKTVAMVPTYDAWVEAWTPKDTMEQRALRDEAMYDVWARDGWLIPVPGKVINYDYAAVRVAEICSLYDVQCIAFDAYAFNKYFRPALDAAGVTVPTIEHPQGGRRKAKDSGLWMPGSKLALESAILEERIRFQDSPVLISAYMSATPDDDAFGNTWFSKEKSTNRIDALISVAMAFGAATGGVKPRMDIDDFLANAVVA